MGLTTDRYNWDSDILAIQEAARRARDSARCQSYDESLFTLLAETLELLGQRLEESVARMRYLESVDEFAGIVAYPWIENPETWREKNV